MQRLEVSGAVRPIYGSLGVKRLIKPSVYFHYSYYSGDQIKKNDFDVCWTVHHCGN